MKEKDEKITKEEEYVALLESRLGDATSQGMAMESQVKSVTVKLNATKVTVWEVGRARAVEVKVRATEVEATALAGTQAIEEYKKSEDFKDEVSEAAYDAFLKGCAECKRKVTKAFPDLDPKSITIEEPEQQEEEVEADAAKEALVIGTEEADEAKVVEDAKEVGVVATKETGAGATQEASAREAARPIGEAAAVEIERAASVRETISKAMAEMEAIINSSQGHQGILDSGG